MITDYCIGCHRQWIFSLLILEFYKFVINVQKEICFQLSKIENIVAVPITFDRQSNNFFFIFPAKIDGENLYAVKCSSYATYAIK